MINNKRRLKFTQYAVFSAVAAAATKNCLYSIHIFLPLNTWCIFTIITYLFPMGTQYTLPLHNQRLFSNEITTVQRSQRDQCECFSHLE